MTQVPDEACTGQQPCAHHATGVPTSTCPPGDHIKFGMPLATTTIQLLLGVIFHTEGYQQQLDRARQTVRWALDYMVKAHSVSSDPSVLVAQVGNGDMDHSYWGRPEQMKMGRPAYTISKNVPGTDVWAATAAALAGGARLFKLRNPTLAATYLTHAQQLFEYVCCLGGKHTAMLIIVCVCACVASRSTGGCWVGSTSTFHTGWQRPVGGPSTANPCRLPTHFTPRVAS